MSIKHLFIVFFIATLFSCERDDICIDENTPQLIIRFHDAIETDDLKSVSNLFVKVTNSLDEIVEINVIKTIDSIVVPLNVDQDYTKITLVKNANIDANAITDEFTLNYTLNSIYVSRSCGYKSIYNDIIVSNSSSNWLSQIQKEVDDIENESIAHLTIFH
ncbi:MAG: DUF6452 family protein [Flavobacteriaceae bacterium]